jgi:hypothetical protein
MLAVTKTGRAEKRQESGPDRIYNTRGTEKRQWAYSETKP